MSFRLGFGPMSKEVIDTISLYTASTGIPLMLIASRNQIDHNSGYVMTTKELIDQIKGFNRSKLWVCRDHCGPYFLDSEKSLSERDAISATKKTIAMDIEQGFDLIHIDTSRISNGYAVAEELIQFCLDLNPNIKFEFGTEENIGVAAGIEKYKNDVEFAKQFPNMKFVVAQTGSLVKEDRQVGIFDIPSVLTLVNYANEAGVNLKEHNADYLNKNQILLRAQCRVHALNIAPQLGVIQTRVLRTAALTDGAINEWNDFANAVIKSNKWEKWIIDGDSDMKVNIAGHYLYQSTEYQKLIDKLNSSWISELHKQITDVIDLYVENL